MSPCACSSASAERLCGAADHADWQLCRSEPPRAVVLQPVSRNDPPHTAASVTSAAIVR